MGITDSIGDMADKAKKAVKGHDDDIKGAVDATGDKVDEKTGGKYKGQVDKGQDAVKGHVDKLGK